MCMQFIGPAGTCAMNFKLLIAKVAEDPTAAQFLHEFLQITAPTTLSCHANYVRDKKFKLIEIKYLKRMIFGVKK